MNKELQKFDIQKKIGEVEVTDEKLSLTFEGGPKMVFGSDHDQDCCEHVYADFSVFKYHKEAMVGLMVGDLVIKSVEGMGFLMCFSCGYRADLKVFVPCYNYQNGYYSDNLALTIDNGGVEIKIDISNLVEDKID